MSEPKYAPVDLTTAEEEAFRLAAEAITAVAQRFEAKNDTPLHVTLDFLPRYSVEDMKSRFYPMWCLKGGYSGLDGSGRAKNFAEAMFRLAGGTYREEVLEAVKKYRERAAELEASAADLPSRTRGGDA